MTMKEVSSEQSIEWKNRDGVRHRVVDWGIILAGVILCFAFCRINIPTTNSSLVWSLLLCFYFFFYRRMAQVIYWSWDTFRLLRRGYGAKAPGDETSTTLDADGLPTFHILIAAYKAGASIGPVITAVANQTYPKDRYYAWIITEHSEQVEADKRADKLVHVALDEHSRNEQSDRLLPFHWRCISQGTASLSEWIEQVSSGGLRGYLSHPGIEPLVLEDLLSFLLRTQDRDAAYKRNVLAKLQLRPREIAIVEREVRRIEESVSRIVGDFARLLGSGQVYERTDIEARLIARSIKKKTLKRISKLICERISDPQVSRRTPERHEIERAARQVSSCTQQAVREVLDRIAQTNIRTLDPHNREYKPGALNIAYRQIKEEGFLEHPENVYFVIIDSDSLLPGHALNAIAQETAQKDQRAMLMQMASLPTANFFSGDWFSKFICFGDAIGAVGKWARSTRRQLKPDLQAGSGVIVPATLSAFIEAQTGRPWDESTLTEDARLIIGQFGMMNCVRNKTKMVPVGLLEAVPEGNNFLLTYKSFWNQRRRWSAGGFGETFYMLTSPTWLRHTRFNDSCNQWEVFVPNPKDRILSRIRQAHRLWLWLWDHFVWGIGGFIVLTHWWLTSFIIGSPGRTFSLAGLAILLVLPILFLMTSARQLSWFIPGGLSKARICLLYFQTFGAIWLYSIPVVVVQAACLLGFRSRIVGWRPTQKPQYQIAAALELEEK